VDSFFCFNALWFDVIWLNHTAGIYQVTASKAMCLKAESLHPLVQPRKKLKKSSLRAPTPMSQTLLEIPDLGLLQFAQLCPGILNFGAINFLINFS
jgi:hypothetical protein